MVESEGPPARLVFHCWSAAGHLQRALDTGAYISFAGNVSFKNADVLRADAALVPDDRLLVETDSPFLSPEPFRGRDNEPARVVAVGVAVAAARGDGCRNDRAADDRERDPALWLERMTGSPDLMGAARVREVLDAHDVRPSKALGQNFVIDPNTIRKMLAVARVSPTDRVLEIGAGAGSLTLGLAAAAPSVVAVERDHRLIPVLRESLGDVSNVEVVHADALAFDFASTRATAVVANLPYNIAAMVVLKVLEEAPEVETLTVMTQREVGERLAATPGTKTYGATSVLVAYFGRARVDSQVSRRAFWPVPRVDSVIVRIERSVPRAGVDPHSFFTVVKSAFSQRRKTLRNSLVEAAGSSAEAESLLTAAGIDPTLRAESLSLDDFLRLADELGNKHR